MTTTAKRALSALVKKSGGTLTDSRALASVNEPAAQKKNTKPKSAPPSRAKKAGRPTRSSRASSKAEKLVCRYCGSDDLSPSFKKRHDARCRACFKKRYGSAARTKGVTRSQKSEAQK